MQYNDYELVYMVSESEEVLEFLLKKYEPLFKNLARTYVKTYKYKGLDYDDIVQCCRITLCSVIDRFDFNKDVLFYSYLIICLRRSVRSFCRSMISKPDCYSYMSIDDYANLDCFVSDFDVCNNSIDNEFICSIIDFKNSLNFLDSQVFELRFNGFSYKDISSLLEINVKKVDNILFKIRKKLEKDFLFS